MDGGGERPHRGLNGGDVMPFAPRTVRVFPLTHVDIGPDSQPRLIVYVELRDRWGDSAKDVGTVEIRLYGPRDASNPAGAEVQASKWEIDLTNLERNAAFFDPATRTYRFQLAKAPDWLRPFAAPKSEQRAAGPEKCTIQIVFTTSDGRTMSDDYLLRR
jgi:hypothetical protein